MLLQHRRLRSTSTCNSSSTLCSSSSTQQCTWHQVLQPLVVAYQVAACLANTCPAVWLQAVVLPSVVCHGQLACTQQQQQQLLLVVALLHLVASWWFLSSSHARAGRDAQRPCVAASRSMASAGARWSMC
jgi:hypothetical protein